MIHARANDAQKCVCLSVRDEIVYFCAHNCFTDSSYLYVQRLIYNDALFTLSLCLKSDDLYSRVPQMFLLVVVSFFQLNHVTGVVFKPDADDIVPLSLGKRSFELFKFFFLV